MLILIIFIIIIDKPIINKKSNIDKDKVKIS